MIIEVCATSANLKYGFDCLGMALSLYNKFTVEPHDGLLIDGVEPQYNNRDNLFCVGYNTIMKKLGEDDHYDYHVTFDTNIPISRGLGSSASLLVAGALAANKMHGERLSTDEVFAACVELEGHPDNVSPAIYGGVTVGYYDGKSIINMPINIDPHIKACVLIPDVHVSTEEARRILPSHYTFAEAKHALSRAMIFIQLLSSSKYEEIKSIPEDEIHEKYRRTLIPDFDEVRSMCYEKGCFSFMISGSGSTCLALSDDPHFSRKLDMSGYSSNWQVMDLEIPSDGYRIY